jgi:1,4-dihydroxy-2-naphthoate octaprenyltransferase
MEARRLNLESGTKAGFVAAWVLALVAVFLAPAFGDGWTIAFLPAGLLVTARGVVLLSESRRSSASDAKLERTTSSYRLGSVTATTSMAAGLVVIGAVWTAVGVAALVT